MCRLHDKKSSCLNPHTEAVYKQRASIGCKSLKSLLLHKENPAGSNLHYGTDGWEYGWLGWGTLSLLWPSPWPPNTNLSATTSSEKTELQDNVAVWLIPTIWWQNQLHWQMLIQEMTLAFLAIWETRMQKQRKCRPPLNAVTHTDRHSVRGQVCEHAGTWWSNSSSGRKGMQRWEMPKQWISSSDRPRENLKTIQTCAGKLKSQRTKILQNLRSFMDTKKGLGML